MPFNGTGTYSPAAAPAFPAVAGQVISSTYFNTVINDIATAMSNMITRDGQGKATAAINWNGQNLTNVNSFGAVTGAFSGNITAANLGTAAALPIDTDATFAANSDARIASQKATLSLISGLITNVLKFKGTSNCGGNPNYNAGTQGDVYIVNGAGLTGGASGVPVAVGDMIVCIANNTGGDQATVGTSWSVVPHVVSGMLQIGNALSELSGVAATARTNIGAAARTPVIQAVASAATVTPTFANDQVIITAQAAALALANPTGTALDGWGIVVRIKDNGTARAISFDTQYRAIGVTLPTTTVISKTLYLGMIFNNADTKWDIVAVAQEA